MQEVVIVGAARTPFGLYGGTLSDQRVQDLAASSMKAAIERSGIDSAELDLCIYSEAKQTSLPSNIGRHGWLLAGLSENPGGFTLNTLCAGALQSLFSGFNKILAGEYQGILTGGAETNSLAPNYLQHPRYNFGPQNSVFHDTKLEVETHAQPVERYGELTASRLADEIAQNYGLTRAELDEYVLAGLDQALNAQESGIFEDSLAPITKKVKKGEITIASDEGPQAFKAMTLEKLMALPALNGKTASSGNVAPLADGAASLVLLSADRAKELGCQPLGKVLGFGITAGNPRLSERTALKSIEKALKNTGLQLEDLDTLDFHEPSAAFSLVVSKQLSANASFRKKLNVNGGSLIYGHAGAATGGAMLVNIIHRMQRIGAKLSLVNVTALGGQSISVILGR